MSIILNEWKNYRDAVYPNGISGIQNKECHQAFIAGALSVTKQIVEAVNLPEDHAVRRMKEIECELLELNKTFAATLTNQQNDHNDHHRTN